jgi:hypothetical protein
MALPLCLGGELKHLLLFFWIHTYNVLVVAKLSYKKLGNVYIT